MYNKINKSKIVKALILLLGFLLNANLIRSQKIMSGDFNFTYKNKFYDSPDTFNTNLRVVFYKDKVNLKAIIFDTENKIIRIIGDSNLEARYNQKDSTIRYYYQSDITRFIYSENNLVKIGAKYYLEQPFSSKTIYTTDSNFLTFQINDPYKLNIHDGIKNEKYRFTLNLKDSIFTYIYSYLEEGENTRENLSTTWQMDEISIHAYKTNHLTKFSFQLVLDSIKNSLPYRYINPKTNPKQTKIQKVIDVGDFFPNINAYSIFTADSFQINNNSKKILFFSFNGCYPCKVSFDVLLKNKSKINADFFILNPIDKKVENLKNQTSKNGFPTNYGLIDRTVFNQFGITYFPTIFILDGNNKIIATYNTINNNNIKDIIAKLRP